MANAKDRLNRRELLNAAAATVVAAMAAGCQGKTKESGGTVREQTTAKHRIYKTAGTPANVSLVKGGDRRQIVYQSLRAIEDEIISSIGNKKILIKPNLVITDEPLCATHVDAVRAILDFLTPHYKGQIIIGESTTSRSPTFEGFKNYGYFELAKEYNVKLVDLNADSWQYGYVLGSSNEPLPIRIISTFLDPNIYIISAARMKTHDRVLVTLSLKNVLLAAPVNNYIKNDKPLVHTDKRAVNTICHYNMFHLAQQVYPDLAVIDGFEAMQGDGPIHGTAFDSRVAIAATDPLAADTIATKIMGFDPGKILYLSTMAEAEMGQGNTDKINIIGADLNQCLYQFEPERHMAEIYNL